MCGRGAPGRPARNRRPGVLKAYAGRDATNREHAGEIQGASGYTDFTDPAAQADLLGWLHARTSLGAERPGTLFDLATARLLERKVLLPGPIVLIPAARQLTSRRRAPDVATATQQRAAGTSCVRAPSHPSTTGSKPCPCVRSPTT